MKEISPCMNTLTSIIKIVPFRLASAQLPDGSRAGGPNENSLSICKTKVCCNANRHQTRTPGAALAPFSIIPNFNIHRKQSKFLGTNQSWASLARFWLIISCPCAVPQICKMLPGECHLQMNKRLKEKALFKKNWISTKADSRAWLRTQIQHNIKARWDHLHAYSWPGNGCREIPVSSVI